MTTYEEQAEAVAAIHRDAQRRADAIIEAFRPMQEEAARIVASPEFQRLHTMLRAALRETEEGDDG